MPAACLSCRRNLQGNGKNSTPKIAQERSSAIENDRIAGAADAAERRAGGSGMGSPDADLFQHPREGARAACTPCAVVHRPHLRHPVHELCRSLRISVGVDEPGEQLRPARVRDRHGRPVRCRLRRHRPADLPRQGLARGAARAAPARRGCGRPQLGAQGGRGTHAQPARGARRRHRPPRRRPPHHLRQRCLLRARRPPARASSSAAPSRCP